MALPFDDPKGFDGTSAKATMYLERPFDIDREILYASSTLRFPQHE
jgi:hypothetical protein